MSKLFIVVNVDWFFLSHRKEIALAAKDKGFDVTVVTSDTGKIGKIRDLGLNVINLPIERAGKNIFNEFKTFLFLFSLYRKYKPDIVHHVGLKTILWGSLAAKIVHVKGIVNAVSGLGSLFANGDKALLSQILISLLKYSHKRRNIKVIFQNNDDRSIFLDNNIIDNNQSFFIKGSGINLKQFCYVPDPKGEVIKVILTARMIEEKGIFTFIDAANLLKNKYKSRLQFILCGGLDENPNSISKEKLESLCDGEYIKWLGYRTDVKDLLGKINIVAFPSYYREGLPKSLIEANAIGRPIITTDSVGCRDAVDDGYNGFLIPIKDSNALAAKIEELLSNDTLRESMGRNAREFAERYFSIDNVVEKHLLIYNELLNNQR